MFSLDFVQQAEVPEDSDDDDPDEVFGFITMLNLTERKVTTQTSAHQPYRLLGCDIWGFSIYMELVNFKILYVFA